MGLSKEEKKRRAEQRRTDKWNREHKLIDGIDHKICSRCDEYKVATENHFYKNKANSTDGLSPNCKVCSRKASNNYRIENDEWYKTYQKQWREENKEYKNDLDRQWYQENKDYRREYLGGWQTEHPEKLRIYSADRKANKEHKISKREWEKCKEFFNDSCAYCGTHISEHYNYYKSELKWSDFHREHVNHEGANDLSNCVPSCKSCNNSKWVKSLEKWYMTSKNFSDERLNKITEWLSHEYKKYIEPPKPKRKYTKKAAKWFK